MKGLEAGRGRGGMMNFDEIIGLARSQRATDVHLEPSAPVTFRVNGELTRASASVSSETLQRIAERLLPDQAWDEFWKKGSADLTRVIAGVTCRINVLRGDRGVGLAVRLLSSQTNTLRSCNLHPQLASLVEREVGLILLTGPTGSGKSTTLSALVEEINQKSARHIITLESPIEYRNSPKKSLIRQREVGLHTPSYEQGLMDALREDPDVIVVGEMRDAESMRWTLNAAETGHLVLATMHAANSADAVYRMMMSFAPERQSSVLAQLGDCLVAIVSQRMSYREDAGLLVPVLEILMGTHATKNAIRKGEATKLISLLQTGGGDGNWTFERYESWLREKSDWVYPVAAPVAEAVEFSEESRVRAPVREAAPSGTMVIPEGPPAIRRRLPQGENTSRRSATEIAAALSGPEPEVRRKPAKAMRVLKDGRIEIPEQEVDLNELLRELEGRAGDGEDA